MFADIILLLRYGSKIQQDTVLKKGKLSFKHITLKLFFCEKKETVCAFNFIHMKTSQKALLSEYTGQYLIKRQILFKFCIIYRRYFGIFGFIYFTKIMYSEWKTKHKHSSHYFLKINQLRIIFLTVSQIISMSFHPHGA